MAWKESGRGPRPASTRGRGAAAARALACVSASAAASAVCWASKRGAFRLEGLEFFFQGRDLVLRGLCLGRFRVLGGGGRRRLGIGEGRFQDRRLGWFRLNLRLGLGFGLEFSLGGFCRHLVDWRGSLGRRIPVRVQSRLFGGGLRRIGPFLLDNLDRDLLRGRCDARLVENGRRQHDRVKCERAHEHDRHAGRHAPDPHARREPSILKAPLDRRPLEAAGGERRARHSAARRNARWSGAPVVQKLGLCLFCGPAGSSL